MNRTEYVAKLERLKKLIDAGNTGLPDALAKKFNISTRTLRRLIADLKEKDGGKIYFDRVTNSYRREEP